MAYFVYSSPDDFVAGTLVRAEDLNSRFTEVAVASQFIEDEMVKRLDFNEAVGTFTLPGVTVADREDYLIGFGVGGAPAFFSLTVLRDLESSAQAAQVASEAAKDAAAADAVSTAQDLADVQTAVKISHAMTQAEFFARAEQNKTNNAASGFVEYGENNTGWNGGGVNKGISTNLHTSTANKLGLGKLVTLNVSGVLQKFRNTGVATNEVDIKFPPAPDGTKTYDSSTGTRTEFATPTLAFASLEKCSNGSFDTDLAGWVPTDTISLVSGKMRVHKVTSGWSHFEFPTIVGQQYIIRVDISNDTAGQSYLTARSNTGASLATQDTLGEGSKFVVFTATTVTSRASLEVYGSDGGTTCDFDNVSIKKITENVITSRKDLVFLESFHENIADKDWVCPLGNVQYGVATWNGITLLNSLIAQGYHAFGDWDSVTKGYGATWSTLTTAQQKQFIADPHNNIYLAEDGALIQVRYRVRVVEGNTSDFTGSNGATSTQGAGEWGMCSGQRVVYVQGSGDSVSSYVFVRAGHAHGEKLGGEVGALAGENDSDALAHTFVAAIPIALCQRLNQGAYHPSFNDKGCGTLNSDNGNAYGGYWHNGATLTPLSQEDCFTSIASSDNATIGVVTGTGDIASGVIFSGHKSGKFYDAIYADQVQDLRLQAQHPTPTQLEPDYWHNRAISGDLKHYAVEGTPRIVVKERGVAEAFANRTALDNGFSVSNVSNYSIGDFVIFINQVNTVVSSGYVRWVDTTYIATSSTYARAIVGEGDTTTTRTNGDTYTILKVEYSTATTQELTWTDVIGDPAHYPRQFTGVIDWNSVSDGSQNVLTGQAIYAEVGHTGGGAIGNVYLRVGADTGIGDLSTYDLTATGFSDLGPKAQFLANATGFAGFPLIYGENGENLIPDGGSKVTKMSRKVIDMLGGLYDNADRGLSWVSFDGWKAEVEGDTNARTAITASGYIYMVTYKTPAHIFKDDANSEVLGWKFGDVLAANSSDQTAAVSFISNLVGNVPTNLSGKGIEYLGGICGHAPWGSELGENVLYNPKHNKSGLGGTGPAAKSLPYLSRDNAQGKLVSCFKEMVYDSSLDDAAEFTQISGTDAGTKVKDTLYRVTSGLYPGAWLATESPGEIGRASCRERV